MNTAAYFALLRISGLPVSHLNYSELKYTRRHFVLLSMELCLSLQRTVVESFLSSKIAYRVVG